MNITFTRTGVRRYRVSVEGPGTVSSWMEPAPGYDARLPHDMAHFVVENELAITGGVFGQLAQGGTANSFHPEAEKAKRKIIRRGKEMAAANRSDSLLSERIVAIACGRWNGDPLAPLLGNEASEQDIVRICKEFDAVSSVWSKLAVGRSMTLVWKGGPASIKHRANRR